MQVREQGRQVQLIRSPYDKSLKRCVQKVVHKFPQSFFYTSVDLTKYLSAEQIADLSADEQKTLIDWLAAKADKRVADDRKSAIDYAVNRIDSLTAAIVACGVDSEKANEIWGAIAGLTKALKKGGHSKPARTAKEAAEDAQEAAGQGNLLPGEPQDPQDPEGSTAP